MGNDSTNSSNDLDLSALSFGPSWAKEETKDKKDYSKYESRSGQEDRKNRRSPQREGGRDFRGKDRGPRREGGGNREFGGRLSRRTEGAGKPRGREETPVPEGYTAEVMPIEDGLDRLAKQIVDTARTYSVFDLARLVLQSRERFNVGLQAPKGATLFRNILSSATFLTKEEALADFWKSEAKEQLYKEVQKQCEAPSGDFPSVAKCTKSGIYLGPPNHHEYQPKLRELHAERFAHLPFEKFQRQIVIEQGEEAVNAWKESVSTQTYYLPLAEYQKALETKSAAPPHSDEPQENAPVAENNEEDTTAATDDDAPPVEPENELEKEAVEVKEETDEGQNEEKSLEPLSYEDVDESLLLKSRAELQRHFLTHHFAHQYKEVSKSWVSGAIPGRLLSPGLLTLLKETVSEERRYPGKLSSLMCRQLSGRHVAVFKVKKKLKAGPSRPHALPDPSTLSERPATLLNWARNNDGKGIDQLWEEVLPAEASDVLKREWYRDLHWLLNQGFVMLMEEGTLFVSKKEEPSSNEKKTGQTSPNKKGKNQKSAPSQLSEEPSENPETRSPDSEPTQRVTAEAASPAQPAESAEVNVEVKAETKAEAEREEGSSGPQEADKE